MHFINLYSANKNMLNIQLYMLNIQFNIHSKQTSPNVGTLLKRVLIPKLLNSPFASWF